ncbi:Rab family GTPase [Pseudoxanthomonas kalamensis]|uniref:Rab family GTPase n=1 Tax=Pseudoxanthomonas kalamensis TaxID=289483 RepID=UPI0013917CCE|nr:Rab family GTPase [Pseudoxanthomonas kalamensis]
MSSIARKISLLGDFGVGKTSTVARAVRNTFSETYLTTVGVKVDSKKLQMANGELRMVLWDIAGANTLDQMRANYIAGTQGTLLVADGTRADTADTALGLWQQAERLLGRSLPAVLLLNKRDLAGEWELPPDRIRELEALLPVFSTSARTGEGVEEAFAALAARLADGGTA